MWPIFSSFCNYRAIYFYFKVHLFLNILTFFYSTWYNCLTFFRTLNYSLKVEAKKFGNDKLVYVAVLILQNVRTHEGNRIKRHMFPLHSRVWISVWNIESTFIKNKLSESRVKEHVLLLFSNIYKRFNGIFFFPRKF